MKFFLDTADLAEIEEAASWGALAGVTTNPSLYAKIGGKLSDFNNHMKRICEIVGPDCPVSAESVAMTRDEIVRDGLQLAEIAPNIVVKIPTMVEGLAATRALADQGVKRIVMHNVSKTPASYILADVFRYKGIIVGSPTYSNQLFPEVEAVLSKIELREVKNRLFGYFGSFSWAGAAVKRLAAFGEKMKWETVGTPAEQKQGMTAADHAACYALGKAMAEQLKSEA